MKFTTRLLALSATVFMLAGPAFAAGLPDATKKMLTKLKLDASILKGLDAELQMPP